MKREQFIALTSTVAVSSGAAGAPIDDYDYDGMMRALTSDAPHKQVFLSNASLVTAPGIAGFFQKMCLAWTTFEFSLVANGRMSLAMTCVLIAEPIVFALNDAMWRKYRIGST
jgi:hypothetical protein